MKAVIFMTPYAVFNFNQKSTERQITLNKSAYESDEANKLLKLITTGEQEAIVIPEEPVFFDSIAMDLIKSGKGSVICNACNRTYSALNLVPIIVGSGGSSLDIQREKQSLLSRLFSKKRKPPSISGGKGYECPEGHYLISVITWKTF